MPDILTDLFQVFMWGAVAFIAVGLLTIIGFCLYAAVPFWALRLWFTLKPVRLRCCGAPVDSGTSAYAVLAGERLDRRPGARSARKSHVCKRKRSELT